MTVIIIRINDFLLSSHSDLDPVIFRCIIPLHTNLDVNLAFVIVMIEVAVADLYFLDFQLAVFSVVAWFRQTIVIIGTTVSVVFESRPNVALRTIGIYGYYATSAARFAIYRNRSFFILQFHFNFVARCGAIPFHAYIHIYLAFAAAVFAIAHVSLYLKPTLWWRFGARFW